MTSASARTSERSTLPRRGLQVLGLVLVSGISLALALSPAATAAPPPATSATDPDFGPNVIVFASSTPQAQIQATVDALHAVQVGNEMGTDRYALLFEPGVYGTTLEPLQMQVGYYTEVAGLGASPGDVVIDGKIEVYNRCLSSSDCHALRNFWRTLSNLTLNVNASGQDGCRASANFWAVARGASMRRVDVNGATLSLMDYCTAGPQFASGGFIADADTGFVINGAQQQWLTRNSVIGSWSNGVWNQTFVGVEGAPVDDSFPTPAYTTFDTNPLSREKPFLFVDDEGAYWVHVPAASTDTSGVTWATDMTPGRSISITRFFIARPSDSAKVINNQLARGLNLLLTPGVYSIDASIAVKRADTVVLGLGHATLTAAKGVVPLTVADVAGVVIAGVTLDAGPVNSPALLRIGTKNGNKNDPDNPTTLSDVYFRVGGPHAGRADVSLEVNSRNVLLDNVWAWRADHGEPGAFGWAVSTGRNGVVVNGDDVTATGLFVEHYQEHNVVWNGENGRTLFFHNTLPVDPPNQAAWQHDGVLGWTAYKVADDVETHELWSGGAGISTNADPTIHAAHAFEVPVAPGVLLHHIFTVNLGAGTIDHVVNDTGAPVTPADVGAPSYVIEIP